MSQDEMISGKGPRRHTSDCNTTGVACSELVFECENHLAQEQGLPCACMMGQEFSDCMQIKQILKVREWRKGIWKFCFRLRGSGDVLCAQVTEKGRAVNIGVGGK